MSHYVIEKNLTTTTSQKVRSGFVSVAISALLIFLLWFMKITVPNPPFENKTGELELDFGMEEVSYGKPDEGGPSETPPAKGGENVDASSATPEAKATGGPGEIVNSTDPTETTEYPSIAPPESSTPQVKPTKPVRDLKALVGKRGNGQVGLENGIEGGKGDKGFGDGKVPGIQGAGGTRVTKNRGNGFFTAKGFTSYELNSNVKRVDADGVGEIVARVRVGSDGKAHIVSILPEGTYTGSAGNARKVMEYFLSHSNFIKVGDKISESGTITLNIKTGLAD